MANKVDGQNKVINH